MKRIPLVRRDGSVRAWTLVDDEDYDTLSEHRWHVNMVSRDRSRPGYAVRHDPTSSKPRLIHMHRVLLGLDFGDPLRADHINGDTLDNRRSNLRAVTHAQNMQNRRKRSPKYASRFRGIEWRPDCGLWRVRPRVNGQQFYVGSFKDELEAALAAEAFRMEHMPFAEPDPELARALEAQAA